MEYKEVGTSCGGRVSRVCRHCHGRLLAELPDGRYKCKKCGKTVEVSELLSKLKDSTPYEVL